MIKKHILFQILIASLTIMATRGFSHDFWLEAHPFYTSPGQTVDISVHVGNQYVGDSLPNITSWYSDFSLYQNDTKIDIKGELGRDPAGYFTAETQGTYAIGYESNFSYTEIDPATFLKYLQDEGLQHAIDYRLENHLTENDGKENYIRHAKTLVQSGNNFSIDESTNSFGYELEIVPLDNPYKKKLNDSLIVKVLYQGTPIAGILLTAFSKQFPEQLQAIRTNSKGEAKIKLDQPGPWLLKATHIIKIENKKYDWQSHWASLTFELIPWSE